MSTTLLKETRSLNRCTESYIGRTFRYTLNNPSIVGINSIVHYHLLQEDHILHLSINGDDNTDVLIKKLPLLPDQRRIGYDKYGNRYLMLFDNTSAYQETQPEIFYDAYVHCLGVLGELFRELTNKGYTFGGISTPRMIPTIDG